jgi:hypothetical protein
MITDFAFLVVSVVSHCVISLFGFVLSVVKYYANIWLQQAYLAF